MKLMLMTMAAASALSLAPPALASPPSEKASDSSELRAELEAGVSSGDIERYEANPLRKSLRKLVSLETKLAADGLTDKENATLRKQSAKLRQQISKVRHSDVREDRRAKADERRVRRATADARRSADSDDREASRAAKAERRSREAAADERRQGASDEKREQRAASDDRRDVAERAVSTTRFDGPTPGDRFPGDVRVGQGVSSRMVAVAEGHRDEFRDTDEYYYRSDDRRIYRLDRKSNLVVGLLDT